MANFAGHAEEISGALNVAVSKTSAREIVIGVKEIGINANGLLEFADRLVILLTEGEGKASCDVGFGQSRCEFQGFLTGTFGAELILFSGAVPLVERGVHNGETGIGWAIVGVERDGVLKHFSTALQVRLRQTRQVLASAQVILIRGGPGLRPQHGLFFVLAKDVAAQGSGYAFGDFVLDRENVVELAIETARPTVEAGSDLDELNGDAQTVVGFANAALEQSAYTEMTADCTNVSAGRPKLKGSGARGHA